MNPATAQLLLEVIQLSTAAIDLAQRARDLNAKSRELYARMKEEGEISVDIQNQIETAFQALEARGFEFR